MLLKTAPQAVLFIARVVDDHGNIAPDKGYEAVVNVCDFLVLFPDFLIFKIGFQLGYGPKSGHYIHFLGP